MPNKNPLFMMEEEQKEHVAKLNKMEREMEEVFERKVLINLIILPSSKQIINGQVREKKQKLSDNERDLERRQNESTTRLQQLKKELEVNNQPVDVVHSYLATTGHTKSLVHPNSKPQ